MYSIFAQERKLPGVRNDPAAELLPANEAAAARWARYFACVIFATWSVVTFLWKNGPLVWPALGEYHIV